MVGTLLPHDVIVADRIRVLPAHPAPVRAKAAGSKGGKAVKAKGAGTARRLRLSPSVLPAAIISFRPTAAVALPSPATAAASDASVSPDNSPKAPASKGPSGYTGVVIDARGLDVLRSPAPAVYGAGPEQTLLYPDRLHVPDADAVQDEVRRPLLPHAGSRPERHCRAESVDSQGAVRGGPAHDGLTVSDEDAVQLAALDSQLHFTRTWKVGFLVPGRPVTDGGVGTFAGRTAHAAL